jgi:hypothetical protein
VTKGYSGWVVFAGVMLFVAGVLNLIYGIAAIADSSFFAGDQRYILGLLQLFAAFSLWNGGLYGRVVAILAASLSAIGALLSIPAYPLWSLCIFALNIIIIHQVTKYGASGDETRAPSPERTAAARREVPRY